MRKLSLYSSLTLFIVLFSCSSLLHAQPWKDKLGDNERNLYKIQSEFNKVYEGREPARGLEEKEKDEENSAGWMIYKRWEWFWSQRVYPTGDLPAPDILQTRMKEYEDKYGKQPTGAIGWSLIGPAVIPTSAGGAGRINCVAVNPADTNIIFVGTASGGLWKSTNGGSSWSTNTDAFGTLGITAIVFDPVDANIMYIATGDADAGDTYSVGVLKSTNGGTTWNTTGLNYSTSSTVTIRALVIHPTNGNILLATTGSGIYKTTNAGTNWSSVASGNFRDLEVNKADPTIWYATKTYVGVYKSTNTGASFSALAGGLPSVVAGRVAIAIAASSPSTVYAIFVNGASGFGGLYRTTDAGTTWTLQSNTPNILSWDGTGSDGQGWYDLVLDVDPTNPAVVYVGGINLYKSSTSGSSWTKITHWYSGAGYPYIHADQHGFAFHPGKNTTIYAANDGGIFRSRNGGTSWTDISSGLAITQFYRLGTSQTNPNRIYAGAQDNGTDAYINGNWDRIIGGDGMEALIDYSNENIGYGELYYGAINRTTDGGNSFSSITNGIGEDGGWITPYVINPINPATLYLGTTKVYRTRNRGNSWTAISGALTGNTLYTLAVAKTDTNTIYAGDNSNLFKTTNGGTTWTNITSGLPGASQTYVAVDPTNAQVVYVTFSGYGSQKVYKTTNGGSSWTNISTGLPSIPTNCITIHPTTTTNLYVGTDVGVYNSSDGGATWQSFSVGLPNVVIDELEFYAAGNKLRAATYGRGIWQISLGAGTGSISGTVFFDENNNGAQDAGEQGLHNWKVQLTGAKTDSLQTDFSGNYIFASLPDGQFTVSVQPQNGWTMTTPVSGSYTMTITDGTMYSGKNFVQFVPGIYESFDGGSFPPTGWSTNVVSGDSSWRKTTVAPRSGTTAAYSHYQTIGTAGSKMLISKRFAFSVGNKELRFWAKRDGAVDKQPDTLKVKLSLTDSLPGSFTETVFACYSGDTTLGDPNVYSTTYKEFVVSLNGYSGPAYLAFVHEDNNGQSLTLDDIIINVGSVGPVFTSTPSSISFGNVPKNSTKVDTLTITNMGSSTMTISNIASSSNQFLVSPLNGTIASFASKKFFITFFPTSAGAKSGYIVFTSNTSTSSDSVAVSGVGAAPLFEIQPTTVAFGNVLFGQPAVDTVTVTNVGTNPLIISSVTTNNAQVTASPTSATIAAADSQKFVVTFTPQTLNSISSMVFFFHNAVGSPSFVTVTGAGAVPVFSASKESITFNKLLIGQSSEDSLVVTNTGGTDLHISSVSSSDAQFVISPMSSTIAPLATETFYCTFTPVSIGGFTSNIIFTHDANSASDTIVVKGNGADTVKYRTFKADTAIAAKPLKIKPVKNKAAFLPNVANWRDTVVIKYNKSKGVTVGLLLPSSLAKNSGWIRFAKGTDVAKFYKTTQTNPAYDAPFDTVRKEGSSKKKKFVRELHPTSEAYTNPLAQAFTVFKLNLYSSKLGITPKGLDSLVYVSPGSQWNGMTLTQIANRVDSVLTLYQSVKLPGGAYATVGLSQLEDLRTLLNNVNNAFYAPIALVNGDSVVTGQGLRFAGMVGMHTISFLDKSNGNSMVALNEPNTAFAEEPTEFLLQQNYPNPFNPVTTIGFKIQDAGLATLTIYDVLGRTVATLVHEQLEAGEYEIEWNAGSQPSGVYFYRLTSATSGGGQFSSVKKLLLMK